jgi:hypothetical protein
MTNLEELMSQKIREAQVSKSGADVSSIENKKERRSSIPIISPVVVNSDTPR